MASLETAVATVFADAAPVTIEHRPYPFRTSFALAEVDLWFADGTDLRLLAKNVSRDSLDGAAADAKPEWVHDARREIAVYERILSRSDLGTPRVYGAAGPWLLLEKLDAVELWQVGDVELWEEAARWLARMHERLREAWSPYLLAHDAPFLHGWLERAREFVGGAVLDRVAAHYHALVRELLSFPQTFVHGEFYPSNVLVGATEGGVRISPVDWEMAGRGPGLLDLAALTTGGWSHEVVRRIAAAYEGRAGEPSGELMNALDLCRLHLAVQWLGWSPNWSPPPEHAQDWLAELTRLADKLGL